MPSVQECYGNNETYRKGDKVLSYIWNLYKILDHQVNLTEGNWTLLILTAVVDITQIHAFLDRWKLKILLKFGTIKIKCHTE